MDTELPPDWEALHAAAWAAGWSLSAGSAGYQAGWRYDAAQLDGTARRAWGSAAGVREWVAGGCAPLTFISLFAGIGGMDLGLERAGMRCVAQVEIDDYATHVLARHWPTVPRWRDVRDCGAHNLPTADLICGGFPCQDISNAGKRAGLAGERSGLWGEFARIIRELRPRYVVVENVAALLGRGMGVVLGDLAACGYDAEWHCIPAAAVGAPHIRDRIFIMAYPNGSRSQTNILQPRILAATEAHTARAATTAWGSSGRNWREWGVRSGVLRVAYGVPNRMDRLRGLGNAVVPQVAELVGRAITAHAQETT